MYQTTYFVTYSMIWVLLTLGLAGALHWTARRLFSDGLSASSKRMLTVARLLAAGMYLVCCGYFAMTCPTDWRFTNLADVAHAISLKAGFLLLLLGIMDIVNLLILTLFKMHLEEAS